MPILIRTSELRRPDRAALTLHRSLAGTDVEVATPPLLWPRWVRTGPTSGRTEFVPIHPAQIPAGWQSVRFTIAHRRATCAEVDCPMYLRGWTEVVVADGNRMPKAGRMTRDQAAAEFGLFGPQALPPQVKHHPAGTTCPRIHKKAVTDIPPLYTVDGRPTLANEFEDALGGGIHMAHKLRKDG